MGLNRTRVELKQILLDGQALPIVQFESNQSGIETDKRVTAAINDA